MVNELHSIGVDSEHLYVDRVALGQPRAFLGEAMASLADGDLLCVPTLASLARSAGELSKILSVLAGRGVELWVAGRRFADLTPTETVDMVATMASDLRREAETLDARKSEETERRRGGQYRTERGRSAGVARGVGRRGRNGAGGCRSARCQSSDAVPGGRAGGLRALTAPRA